ncbi:Dabb family protein, partial [uncultured Muriicola sp.]|uniref:Dabb family protein n=1 Tax=uncultured Muriicola sp. TaxID=1583102 RepID=UPI002604A3D1
MKFYLSLIAILMALYTWGFNQTSMTAENPLPGTKIDQDSVLRHVVLFKFKEGTTKKQLEEVENAFVALKNKIPEIESLEWGQNNSPEGLNKGFTHCFFLTFASEAAREVYLPHPDHKAFGALL